MERKLFLLFSRFNVSFWLVLNDIRQGAFYATLACFWLVFTGEHLMDSAHGPKPAGSEYFGLNSYYWPKLLLVGGCCAALSIFELAERGVQLHNPFYRFVFHWHSSAFFLFNWWLHSLSYRKTTYSFNKFHLIDIRVSYNIIHEDIGKCKGIISNPKLFQKCKMLATIWSNGRVYLSFFRTLFSKTELAI